MQHRVQLDIVSENRSNRLHFIKIAHKGKEVKTCRFGQKGVGCRSTRHGAFAITARGVCHFCLPRLEKRHGKKCAKTDKNCPFCKANLTKRHSEFGIRELTVSYNGLQQKHFRNTTRFKPLFWSWGRKVPCGRFRAVLSKRQKQQV